MTSKSCGRLLASLLAVAVVVGIGCNGWDRPGSNSSTGTPSTPAVPVSLSPTPTGPVSEAVARSEATVGSDARQPPSESTTERTGQQDADDGAATTERRVEYFVNVDGGYANTPSRPSCFFDLRVGQFEWNDGEWARHAFVRWGADGQEVLFGLGPAIYAASTDGRDLTNVVPPRVFGFGRPPWSWSDFVGTMIAFDVAPDGQRIAYSTCEDRSNGLTRGDPTYDRDRPDSRDDVRDRDPPGEPVIVVGGYADIFRHQGFQYEIAVATIDGSDARRLTTEPDRSNYPAWSPDGRRIAYVRGDSISPPTRLVTMAADGSDARILVSSVRRQIAWLASRPPAWSPDGQRIAFAGAGTDSRVGVYSVAADGSDLRRLADSVSPPTWSPDGSRLAFVKPYRDLLSVYTMSADGSDVRRVATLPDWPIPPSRVPDDTWWPTWVWIRSFAWSPDGSKILIDARLSARPELPPGLFVVDVEGSDVVRLPSRVWAIADASWSPDGSRIAVLADRERKLRARGNPRPMVVLTVAPDGTDVRVLATGSVGTGVRTTGLRRTQPPADLAACMAGVAVVNPQDNPGLVQDCEALLTIQHSLGGIERLNWRGDRPMAEWTGVTIEGTPPRVRRLSLRDLDLPGAIPAAVGRLSDLRVLDLSDNRLSGGIPEELGSLASLQSLNLSSNYLHGEIPHALGALHSLESLWLSGNYLHGPIPTALTGLSNLYRLRLDYNLLSGTVPAELAELPRLRYLTLRENQFSGCLPTALHSVIDDPNTLYLPNCKASP